MTIQITILGLGQIGASAGLALGKYPDKILRVGHDKDHSVSQKTKKKQAVDKTMLNLSNSVKDADAVLLALPAHEVRPTLEHIAQDIKEGAVIIDTVPMKRAVVAWAEEFLPPQRYYVGLSPVLNPKYLRNFDSGVEAAHKGLFEGTIMGLVSSSNANSQALDFVTNFVKLLGAEPYFVGAVESDGLMTATHIFPHLAAVSLVSSITARPGWREAQKFASRAFAQVSEPVSFGESPEALAKLLVHNSDNAERVIDDLIYVLRDLKKTILDKEEEALQEYLQEVAQKRNRWWVDREDGKWLDPQAGGEKTTFEAPSLLKRLLGFDGSRRRRLEED